MKGPLFGVSPLAAAKGHAVWGEIAPELTPRDFRSPFAMDVAFLRLLSRARRRAGVPFRVISDYRDPARNEAAGGAEKSAHMECPCRAVDLQVRDNHERARIVLAAAEEGFLRIGVYPAHEDGGGSLHLDASETNPAPRIWTRF
jgi:uncharacterized protein YcbK (DUF882 family)